MRPELFRGIEAGTRDFCDMQIISSGPDKTTQQIHDNYLRLINKAQKASISRHRILSRMKRS